MKKLLALALFFASALVFAQSEETRNLSSFSSLSAHEGVDVFLKKGSKESAKIKARGIDLDDVLTDVSGGKLKIHLAGNNHRNVDVEVTVTYTSLSALSVSSAASIEGDDQISTSGDFKIGASSAGDIDVSVKADDMDVSASSAADVNLELDVNTLEVEVSSAADIDVKGSAKEQDISASSAGSYDGIELQSETVEVSASSGGGAKVHVTEQLNARVSSGGSVRYKGNPRMDISSSSGGTIKKY